MKAVLRILPRLAVSLLPALAPLQASTVPADFSPAAADVAQPKDLPAVGKWMLDPDLTPAHWLGEIHEGKPLREPINIIVIDRAADSAEEARQRLLQASAAAGYPPREGHSAGYFGYIGDALHPELPGGRHRALSDRPFEIDNNHGRLFGPYRHRDGYIFIGAFSREKVEPFEHIKHRFVSFNRARDDYADRMDRHTDFARSGWVELDNTLIGSAPAHTGDHDGIAVLLVTEP